MYIWKLLFFGDKSQAYQLVTLHQQYNYTYAGYAMSCFDRGNATYCLLFYFSLFHLASIILLENEANLHLKISLHLYQLLKGHLYPAVNGKKYPYSHSLFICIKRNNKAMAKGYVMLLILYLCI